MPSIIEQFGLEALSVADRIALAQALWDSVHEAQENDPVTPELRAELIRRAALADAEPARGVPWQEVREAAKARWAQ